MDLKLIINFILFTITKAITSDTIKNSSIILKNDTPDVFNGVYSECFLHLSYSCLQKKTLLYLKELNSLSEVSVIGEYVKFVKIKNKSDTEVGDEEETKAGDSEELAFMIDQAIDNFFDNHVLKFYALGRNLSMPRNVEEFVGRKKRKGGGGMGGGHGDGGGHDDGGKKKMMMMAMMCMKMKLMMMVPAMMGMMGMMSFKGMMFSMMSFMLSKMMLLMKILEKKGGSGGLGGGGGGSLDGGWAAGGAGSGAWMPAGGQDYTGGGGGGGYDANGQWQSRSIVENLDTYKTIENHPIVTIIKPTDSYKWQNEGINSKKDSKQWQSKKKDKAIVTFSKPVNNGQWWSRSIDTNSDQGTENEPEISFVKRALRFNNKIERESYKKPVLVYKKSNVNFDFEDPGNTLGQGNENVDDIKSKLRLKRDIGLKIKRVNQNGFKWNIQNDNDVDRTNKNINAGNKDVRTEIFKSRQKRSIIDLLQNSYIYWVNKILGLNNNRRTNPPKYKMVNGIKYVYYPYRWQKPKMLKELQMVGNQNEDLKPLVAVEDFNKGEILVVEGGTESRMNKKKFNKMKDSVNDTVEDNPWE